MDLAYICELESDRTIEIFGAKRWDASSGPPPRELSRRKCNFICVANVKSGVEVNEVAASTINFVILLI
jgi:hypothetical protein